jgi:hypothetical protein
VVEPLVRSARGGPLREVLSLLTEEHRAGTRIFNEIAVHPVVEAEEDVNSEARIADRFYAAELMTVEAYYEHADLDVVTRRFRNHLFPLVRRWLEPPVD